MRREVFVFLLFCFLQQAFGTVTVVYQIGVLGEDPNVVAQRMLAAYSGGNNTLGNVTILSLAQGNTNITPSPPVSGPTSSPTTAPTVTPTTTPATTPTSGNTPAGYTNVFELIPGELTLYSKPRAADADKIEYALVGHGHTGWIGAGFTGGQLQMVGSDAVVGMVVNGVATVRSYLMNGQNSAADFTPDTFPVEPTSGDETDGTTTIYFTRQYNTGAHPITADSPPVYIGAVGESDVLAYHGLRSEQAISDSGAVIGRKPGIKDAHGALMLAGWGIIIPFGILWARYAKPLPEALWFKVHRITQPLGYVMAIAGFILAFIMVNGAHFREVAHSGIGITLMILGLVQIIVAVFRPHKDPGQKTTTARRAFEYFHLWHGRALALLAIAQCIYGWFILSWPVWVIIVYAILLAAALVFIIVKEIQAHSGGYKKPKATN